MPTLSNPQTGSFDFLLKACRRLDSVLRNYAAKRPAHWMFFAIVMAVMISFFSRFPLYRGEGGDFPGSLAHFRNTPYGQAINWWLGHPFQQVLAEKFFGPGADQIRGLKGPVSHCDKLTFRAFIPALGYATNGGLLTLVVANHLASLVTFILIYLICLRSTGTRFVATLATWAYATCWAGSSGFNDFIYGDAVGMALLLVTLVTNRFMPVAACVFFAGFTDERAICTAPLIILFRYWQLHPPFAETNAPLDSKYLKQAGLPVLAGVLAYGIVRLYVSHRFDLATGTSLMASRQIPAFHFCINYPGTLFKVFEFLWLAPVLMVLSLAFADKPRRGCLTAYALCMFLASAPALLVWDFDRSIFYLLPAVLASICFAPGTMEERMQIILGLFVASFFWLNPLESWLRYLLN